MLDEKGRLFGKINIIDLAVIVLIIAAATGIGYNYLYAKSNKVAPGVKSLFYSNAAAVPVEFELRISGVRDVTVDAIETGDKLYDKTTKTYLGKVTKKEAFPHEDFITKSDGTKIMAPVPERYEMQLWVEFDGVERNGEFATQSNLSVTRGGTINFNSEKVSSSGTVTDVYSKENK